MAIWIDWYSHHTPPEVAARFGEPTGKEPPTNNFDSPDFSERVRELDAAGLDLQLISQGAGRHADQLAASQALAVVRQSKPLIAERIALHRDRLARITLCR
ncbi:MAG: hypothetical protein ACM37Z_06220 [Deltaproteobacteria bacterium]